jgi:hypothetical protein
MGKNMEHKYDKPGMIVRRHISEATQVTDCDCTSDLNDEEIEDERSDHQFSSEIGALCGDGI